MATSHCLSIHNVSDIRMRARNLSEGHGHVFDVVLDDNIRFDTGPTLKLFVDDKHAARILRAVEAFNAEMAKVVEPANTEELEEA